MTETRNGAGAIHSLPLHILLAPATPGSAEAHRVREEVLALAGAGHAPLLLAPAGLPPIEGVSSATISEGGPLGLFSGAKLRRQASDLSRHRTPTCVHAHGWGAVRAAQQIARDLGVALVCDVGDPLRPPRPEKGLLGSLDRIISCSASVVRQVAAEVRPGHVVHIPGSLDPSDLPPAPAVPFRLPPGRDLLVVFAPLAEGDADSLLAALDAALSAHPALHLVLLGEPIGATFMKAVSAHRMVPRVTFGGLPPLSAAARLFDASRAIFFALPDPGLVEPYALLALSGGAPLLALPGDDARALFGGRALDAPEADASALGAALGRALASGRREPHAPAAEHQRPALAERLIRVYEGAVRSGSSV